MKKKLIMIWSYLLLKNQSDKIHEILKVELSKKGAVKWFLCVQVIVMKNVDNEIIESSPYFRSYFIDLQNEGQIDDQLPNAYNNFKCFL